MAIHQRAIGVVLSALLTAAPVRAAHPRDDEIALSSWGAPPYWSASPRGAAGRLAPESPEATTPILPFTALTPCRIVDTRGGAPLGGGPLAAGVPRNYTLTGQCGLPVGAAAVSLNVTVTNTQGPGFIQMYPQGGAAPTVSTLNYVAGDTLANAAIAPLGSGGNAGGLTVVAGVSGTDLIIDTNGYYAPVPVVNTVNALSGDITLSPGGSNVSITPSGSTLTIATTGTISAVSPGTALSGGGSSGTVTLNVNLAGTGSANSAAYSDHDHDATYQKKYATTVVVSPVGTTTQNGAALLAALAAIPSPTAGSPWLLKIEPGVYNVGATPLTTRQYVDIEGSGEGVTVIRGSGSSSTPAATVQCTNNVELRFLTVENTGGDSNGNAIYAGGGSPRLTHVTATAAGATSQNVGIWVSGASSAAVLTDVSANATSTGGAVGAAIIAEAGASPKIRNSTGTAAGGATAFSFYITLGSTPDVNGLTVYASGATNTYGVYIDSSSPILNHVTARVTGGATAAYGLYSSAGGAQIRDLTIDLTSGSVNFGLFCSAGSLTLTQAKVFVAGTTLAKGTYLNGCTADLVNAKIEASGATAYGIHSVNTSAQLRDAVINIASATTAAYGISASGSSITATKLNDYVNVAGTAKGVELTNSSSFNLVNGRIDAYGTPTGQGIDAATSGARVFASAIGATTFSMTGDATGSGSTWTLEADQSTLGATNAGNKTVVLLYGDSAYGAVTTSGTGAKSCFGVVDVVGAQFRTNTCP